MRLVLSLLAILGFAGAFAPIKQGIRISTVRSFGMDPSHFHEIPQHVDNLLSFGSMLLSDLDVDTAVSAASSVADAATSSSVGADATSMAIDAASSVGTDAAADTAAAAATTGSGPFGFLAGPIESLLQGIHAVLVAVGISSNSWGISIIVMTVLIKVLTFPLTKTQLESTNKMQAMQPQIKEIQNKYQSNAEVMNQKMAEMYQQNDVNPLSGCIPSLVQIPVFIGLYRAVFNLAKEDKLNEPFLFLPNLEGPTYGADPAHGNDWLLKGWTDGTPSLGWDDTTSFLILPALLVVSQFVSVQLMQPDSEEARAQQPFFLKLLPLMIGWFSLSVPAALTIYWFSNNIITTASTLYVKSTMPAVEPVGVGSTTTTPEVSVFTPPVREKPSGFASTAYSEGGVKPITPVDAEIIEDGEEDNVVEDSTPSGTGIETGGSTKKRGKKKKKKKN